jgi:hypothetical protein
MGYDLHITRRPVWTDDDGPQITLEEWKAYVESDNEVRPDTVNGLTYFLWTAHPKEPWPLRWDRGELYAKNPDEITIRKLVTVAGRLRATVQGDDGEVYRADGTSVQPESAATSPPAASPSWLSRIGSWSRRRRDVRQLQQQDTAAFRVGQRVKNPWGDLGTVLYVDRDSNAGMGSVRVRLDDGREQHWSYVASGLDVVEPAADGG